MAQSTTTLDKLRARLHGSSLLSPQQLGSWGRRIQVEGQPVQLGKPLSQNLKSNKGLGCSSVVSACLAHARHWVQSKRETKKLEKSIGMCLLWVSRATGHFWIEWRLKERVQSERFVRRVEEEWSTVEKRATQQAWKLLVLNGGKAGRSVGSRSFLWTSVSSDKDCPLLPT